MSTVIDGQFRSQVHRSVVLIALHIIRLTLASLGIEPGSRMEDADDVNHDGAIHKLQKKRIQLMKIIMIINN